MKPIFVLLFNVILILNAFSQDNALYHQDIKVTYPTDTAKAIPAQFKSMSDIPTLWIKLERDSLGFFVYEPCNGNTPIIQIDKEMLILIEQLETISYSYEKFTRCANNTAFRMDVYAGDNQTGFEITATIFNAKEGIVKWKIGDSVWFMTPFENSTHFRTIRLICDKEMKPELEFR